MSDALARLQSDVSFENETFVGLDAQGFDLSAKEFYGCTFRDCALSQSVWSKARLEDCVFEGCDLTRAVLKELALRGATFKGCKLLGTDWSNVAEYPDMSLTDCNLHYASFVDMSLRKMRFIKCALNESSFVRVDLVESLFDACDCVGAVFDGCDLRNASFAHSLNAFIDPAKNQVKNLRIPSGSAVLLAKSLGMKVVD